MKRVEVHGLVKRWGETRAVDGVSFTVPAGSLTVLLGPSGCGKSTILRMIAGLETATEGRISIDGRDVTTLDPAKRGVSMVFQSYALFPHLSVRENILFGLKVRKVPEAERADRLARAADMVGLAALLDRKPAQLSGGQRQRVALARTIVSEQPVCLMDEPLSNLDAKLRAEMRDDIRALKARLGLTMIYVTHDQTEAMTMADEVVLLRDGRIEQAGGPHDLYQRPVTAFAAHFIGVPPMNLLPLTPAMKSTLPDAITALFETRFPTFNPARAAGPWSVGIRPEDVALGDAGPMLPVDDVEYLGSESIVRFRLADRMLMARVPGRASLVSGDRIAVTWAPKDTHFFDDQGVRQDGQAAALPLPA